MKLILMKLNRAHKTQGFTLVELLVVIVIIASLAAVALSLGPRMMARARATESMQNIRQIAPLLLTYAADHSMTLPPVKGDVKLPDGTVELLQWNEVCMNLIYPESKLTQLRSKTWWDSNKSILKNPMYKDSTMLTPGYAMNEMIAQNIDASGDESTTVPLSLISDPTRTPLIAPFTNYHYKFDSGEIAGFKKEPLSTLLSGDRLPIVFVDGHMENMTPKEYVNRKLDEMPLQSDN